MSFVSSLGKSDHEISWFIQSNILNFAYVDPEYSETLLAVYILAGMDLSLYLYSHIMELTLLYPNRNFGHQMTDLFT